MLLVHGKKDFEIESSHSATLFHHSLYLTDSDPNHDDANNKMMKNKKSDKEQTFFTLNDTSLYHTSELLENEAKIYYSLPQEKSLKKIQLIEVLHASHNDLASFDVVWDTITKWVEHE